MIPGADGPSSAVERASHLIRLERYAEAEPLLRRALAAEPEDYRALTGLAWLLDLTDRPGEAEAVARFVIARFPEEVEGYLRLTSVLTGLDRYDEAEPAIARAAELAPHDPSVLRQLAEVLGHFPERREEALVVADRAIELAPQEAPGHRSRAIVLVHLRRWEDAETSLLEALQLDPTNTSSLVSSGLVRLRLGRIEEARTEFMTALRLKPSAARVREVLGILETSGLPAPLLDVYTAACAALGVPDLGRPGVAGSDPVLMGQQIGLARSMWQASAYNHPWSKASRDRCRALVAAVLADDPSHVDGRILAAQMADEDDRPGDALTHAGGLLNEGVDSFTLFRYVANALRRMERYDEALEAAAEGWRRYPDTAAAAALYGTMLAQLGRGEEALMAASRAVELAPQDPHQYTSLGRVHRDLGYKDSAKAAFQAALDLDPDDATARFELGSLLMLGYTDYVGAERELVKIAMADPGGDRHAVLGHVRFLLGRWAEAVADFETALAMPMRSNNTPLLIVNALELFGAPGPFRPIYEYCLALTGRTAPEGPPDPESVLGLAVLLMKRGVYPEAADLAAEVLHLDPDNEFANLIARILADPDLPDHAEALAGIRED